MDEAAHGCETGLDLLQKTSGLAWLRDVGLTGPYAGTGRGEGIDRGLRGWRGGAASGQCDVLRAPCDEPACDREPKGAATAGDQIRSVRVNDRRGCRAVAAAHQTRHVALASPERDTIVRR